MDEKLVDWKGLTEDELLCLKRVVSEECSRIGVFYRDLYDSNRALWKLAFRLGFIPAEDVLRVMSGGWS